PWDNICEAIQCIMGLILFDVGTLKTGRRVPDTDKQMLPLVSWILIKIVWIKITIKIYIS
ncbi:unnamed protein product, partial [Rotaria sp. Silwood1]